MTDKTVSNTVEIPETVKELDDMTKTTKATQYAQKTKESQELTAKLREEYTNRALPLEDYEERKAVVNQLATEYNLNEKSVIARLRGIYISKKESDTGKRGVKKADLVNEIVNRMDIDITESEQEYLGRLTKGLLNKLIDSLDKQFYDSVE